jgi:hypothetical protein
MKEAGNSGRNSAVSIKRGLSFSATVSALGRGAAVRRIRIVV